MITKKIIAISLIVIAILFAILETNYFGWNAFPESKEEFICDTIAVIIFLTGFSIHKQKD